jgi:UDP-N-acetylglucosamine--N-acetylmuramyl-(pentapeptide) pyrophosphoryl-undecaprenol N-acetylglucosamine transferase
MPEVQAPLTVCLTGGGTAGHVNPNLALVPGMRARGWQIYYVATKGLEKPLVEAAGVEFHAIASGKLRRYLSLQNFFDLFKVAFGVLQCLGLFLQRRPDVIFSKGGFVAVPVAVAGWILRIPVVSHESDLTPGLANKLIAPFARQILYTFPETKRYVPASAAHVGTPVRSELFTGDRERGAKFCGMDPAAKQPVFLVMGGSQGAQRVNELVRDVLPWIMEQGRLVHLTGAGKGIGYVHPNYRAFEYVREELKDVLAFTDYVIARAGANSIFEFLALRKPMLLVPLEQGSRGDQVINAEAFEKSGWAMVRREKDLDAGSFKAALMELMLRGPEMKKQQALFDGRVAESNILAAIDRAGARTGGRA